MRFLSAFATFVAASIIPVTAQSTTGSASNVSLGQQMALQEMQEALPQCALQCLATLIPQAGCDVTDVECICTSAELTEASTLCLASNCTVVDTFATMKYQADMCGVPERDRSREVIITIWVLFTLVVVCVVCRFLARSNRLFNGPGYSWDDWMIAIAMPCLLAGNTMSDIMARRGLGHDIWMLEPDQIEDILMLFWTNQFTYIAMLLFTKISILLLYLRVFPHHAVGPWFHKTVYILIGLMSAYAISMWFAIAFECNPISYAWTSWRGEPGGYCVDLLALIYSCAALNIVFDFLVFALPIPQVWKLQLNMRAKVAVSLTFLVGLFATICSIVRLQYLVKWGHSENPSWDYVDLTIWSLVEGNAVVICACMPPMANLFKKFFAQATTYFSSRSKGGSDYYNKSSGSANHNMDRLGPPDGGIKKMETTTVAYDRAPSERSGDDEVELMAKGKDPRWEADEMPRRFV